MKPIRVLLVEDNPGDADLTLDTLEESLLSYETCVVTDGAAAVDYLLRRGAYTDAETPDLVLLDLNLPKLGGREVLAELRSHEELRSVPVVVLTSSDAQKDIVESYRLGANCYVTKPGDLTSFQAAIRSIETFWFGVVKLPASHFTPHAIG